MWLSTAYGRRTAYVAVHQYWRTDRRRLFAAVQEIMVAHEGRPHWGKEHAVARDYLETVYPRLGDHLAVRADVDPSVAFLNTHVRQVLGL